MRGFGPLRSRIAPSTRIGQTMIVLFHWLLTSGIEAGNLCDPYCFCVVSLETRNHGYLNYSFYAIYLCPLHLLTGFVIFSHVAALELVFSFKTIFAMRTGRCRLYSTSTEIFLDRELARTKLKLSVYSRHSLCRLNAGHI
jgi:hypothetical protein